jgi:hypothetical protein
LKAGNELDLLVAEHVLGWQWQVVPRHIHIVGEDALKFEGQDAIALMPPNAVFPPHEVGQGRLFYQAIVGAYSKDMEHTLKVIEHYKHFRIESKDGQYTCQFPTSRRDRPGMSVSTGNTIPEAVCLAALDAEGYDTTT